MMAMYMATWYMDRLGRLDGRYATSRLDGRLRVLNASSALCQQVGFKIRFSSEVELKSGERGVRELRNNENV